MAELLALNAGCIGAAVLALWLVSLWLRDASIVDVFWGPGFALVAGVCALASPALSAPRGRLLLALTALWGLRLGAYLLWRNAGHGEDRRYVAMRRHWGPRFAWVSLFTVFGLQGALMWVISLPVQVAAVAPGGALGALDAFGIALFALGFGFEAVADLQLARFKADPAHAGAVMDRGLWRYSRHPNYFGNACLWWGLWALAASTPWGPYTVFAPALMTFLLLRVSGVALLERTIHKRRPDYTAYRERTSAFIPLPPRG